MNGTKESSIRLCYTSREVQTFVETQFVQVCVFLFTIVVLGTWFQAYDPQSRNLATWKVLFATSLGLSLGPVVDDSAWVPTLHTCMWWIAWLGSAGCILRLNTWPLDCWMRHFRWHLAGHVTLAQQRGVGMWVHMVVCAIPGADWPLGRSTEWDIEGHAFLVNYFMCTVWLHLLFLDLLQTYQHGKCITKMGIAWTTGLTIWCTSQIRRMCKAPMIAILRGEVLAPHFQCLSCGGI